MGSGCSPFRIAVISSVESLCIILILCVLRDGVFFQRMKDMQMKLVTSHLLRGGSSNVIATGPFSLRSHGPRGHWARLHSDSAWRTFVVSLRLF